MVFPVRGLSFSRYPASRLNTFRSIITYMNISTTSFIDVDDDKLVKVKIEPSDNTIAALILDRPPSNSLSLEMCAAISTKIKSIENDHPKVKSLILSSSNPSIFSAGIDLKELYSPCPERLPKFWTAFQNLFVDLYGSRLAVIGAIEGHAPAAGCMLAMACDYRIMAASVPGEAPFKIGLNETRFGIVAPPWMAQLMIRTIGFRKAEHALSLGTLFTPENARNIGLVDELVPTSQNVLEICRKTAEKWNEIPMQARSITKMLTRKELLEELISTREGDKENFCKLVQSEPVQTALGLYLKRLKRK